MSRAYCFHIAFDIASALSSSSSLCPLLLRREGGDQSPICDPFPLTHTHVRKSLRTLFDRERERAFSSFVRTE